MTHIFQSLPPESGVQMLTSNNKMPFVFGDKVYVSPCWPETQAGPDCGDPFSLLSAGTTSSSHFAFLVYILDAGNCMSSF